MAARRWAGRRSRRIVGGALLVVMLALVAGWAPEGRRPPRPQVGVQFHGLWSDYSDAQRAAVLDRLVDAGIGWVRIDLSWAMLQPEGPDTFSPAGIERTDDLIAMARERDLDVLGMFWLTPAWANEGAGERAAPTLASHYAAALAWAAGRYRSTVSAWEVWNEPNDPAFLAGSDPGAYAALLRAAYPAVKAVAPEVAVVFGGTSLNDAEWIGRAYAAGAGGSFDVLATHPYQRSSDLPPEAPDDGTKERLTHVERVREVMVDNGDADTPIWFTEFGWSSHDADRAGQPPWSRGVTRQQQADYLARTLRMVADRWPFVTHVFWYRERDASRGNVQNDNYGLLDRNLQPKAAWYRLRSVLGRN